MGEKKPFHRGENVIVRVKSPAGLITEHECRVKEMAGARDVVIELFGRDRIVSVKDVRKVFARNPAPIDQVEQAPPEPKLRLVKLPPRNKQPLSASIGESVMAKIPAPGHFEAKSEDPKDISVVLRATRNSRSVTQELMAQMLRVKTEELIAFESGADLPSDDVVLRLADVLSVPLDPLIAALEHTKEKDAKIRAAREAAEKETLEKQRLAREAKARFEEQERARSELAKSEKKPTMRTATEMPRRTLEDFGERLMDIAPVPVDPTRRKQWWTCARILFELDGA